MSKQDGATAKSAEDIQATGPADAESEALAETGEGAQEELASERELDECLTPGVAEEGGGEDQDLAKALEQARCEHDKMLRMAAELENFKKRMGRERETALKYAEENILKELLPFIDNLERAMEQGRNTESVEGLMEGLEMTLNGLLSSLEKFGLTPIAGVGEPFDPNFHEALAMEASKDVPENGILQEYEKGYLYKDRLIRAAKVVVSKGDAEA